MRLISGRWQVFKNLYSGIRSFQDNLADGKPNDWRCRAGARYLYICENGLVHYCSQQRGFPGVPLAGYTIDDIRRELLDAEVVRAALHDRLRPPRLDDGLLAQAAEAGAGRSAGLRQRGVLIHAWPTPSPSISRPGVDIQEVDNAVNQARKEVAQRYDFKGSRASIDLNREGQHARRSSRTTSSR